MTAAKISYDAKYVVTVGNEKCQILKFWLWTCGQDVPDGKFLKLLKNLNIKPQFSLFYHFKSSSYNYHFSNLKFGFCHRFLVLKICHLTFLASIELEATKRDRVKEISFNDNNSDQFILTLEHHVLFITWVSYSEPRKKLILFSEISKFYF